MRISHGRGLVLGIAAALLLAACGGGDSPPVFQATAAGDDPAAPVYTGTPSPVPASPTSTPSPTPTYTPTPEATPTPAISPTPSPTPTTQATLPLLTLTPPIPATGAPYTNPAAVLSANQGWSCDDFPCEDDIAGFLQRIRVPAGYRVEHVGRFPGQPMQIVYGPDGRLYATVLENGGRQGAVYVMDADGAAQRYAPAPGRSFHSPVGLAFQPGTAVLYVSSRLAPVAGGGLWRVQPDGSAELVLNDLPCCFSLIDNQPAGMVFGPDGYLYLGVGALTDHLEPVDPRLQNYAELQPLEASILRIQPHTGQVDIFASGIRSPYDLTFDSGGQFYATDNGVAAGPGDRLLAVSAGGNYGWPYWRGRGCEECPPGNTANVTPDLLPFPDYTLPRGLVAYTGDQFPPNMFDSLFVTLWNGVPSGQRVVRINPRDLPADPAALAQVTPEPFVTGLIRPVDVTVAPDGSLVVADFIYGHVWRVRYTAGESSATVFATATPAQ